tara:strand:+ start:533 stop:1318 length:786 start_codon:yes stop_codon:yes gene_type:complete
VSLSIIIFSRNDCENLRNCLMTLLERPSAELLEVIVIDNASEDNSAHMLVDFPSELPLCVISLQQDSSFSHGNNLGLKQARGELILFLNPDTFPDGKVIDRCITELRKNPSLGMVGPRLRYPDGQHQQNGWYLPSPQQLLRQHLRLRPSEVPSLGLQVTPVGWLMGCFLMSRRAVLEELGGFDPDFWFHGTDLELCARVQQLGLSLGRVEAAQLTHIGHRAWPAERRRASQRALIQYLRREQGPLIASSAALVAHCLESLR